MIVGNEDIFEYFKSSCGFDGLRTLLQAGNTAVRTLACAAIVDDCNTKGKLYIETIVENGLIQLIENLLRHVSEPSVIFSLLGLIKTLITVRIARVEVVKPIFLNLICQFLFEGTDIDLMQLSCDICTFIAGEDNNNFRKNFMSISNINESEPEFHLPLIERVKDIASGKTFYRKSSQSRSRIQLPDQYCTNGSFGLSATDYEENAALLQSIQIVSHNAAHIVAGATGPLSLMFSHSMFKKLSFIVFRRWGRCEIR